jgi:hypothetical protein
MPVPWSPTGIPAAVCVCVCVCLCVHECVLIVVCFHRLCRVGARRRDGAERSARVRTRVFKRSSMKCRGLPALSASSCSSTPVALCYVVLGRKGTPTKYKESNTNDHNAQHNVRIRNISIIDYANLNKVKHPTKKNPAVKKTIAVVRTDFLATFQPEYTLLRHFEPCRSGTRK